MKLTRTYHRLVNPHAIRMSMAMLFMLLTGPVCLGDVTVYQTGFESPFVPGNLSGQAGWSSVATIDSPAVIAPGGNGGQGVELTRGANIGAAADANYLINLSTETFTDFVAVDWDMKVMSTGQTPKPFGPFFGMDNFATDNTTRRVGFVGMDATTGEVLYSQPGNGALLVDNNTVPLGAWHRWSMVMDFNSKTFDVTVNTITVLNDIGFADATVDIDDFVASAMTTFAASLDPQSIHAGGTAFFDNYAIRSGNPPITGDLDLDGFVGIVDLGLILARWNLNVTPGDIGLGDPSGDGFVGIDDLDIVLGNWNAGTPPLAGASANLPEPGVLGLLCVGGLWVLRRRSA